MSEPAPASPSLSLSRSRSGIAKDEWIGQQVKTFTRWVNDHLKKCPVTPIEDISADFDDGVRLVLLIRSLYNKENPKSFTMQPKHIYDKRANIEAGFDLMKDVGIRLPVTQVSHIVDHNQKMILGMIWVIILHFNNKRIHELQFLQDPDTIPPVPGSPEKATSSPSLSSSAPSAAASSPHPHPSPAPSSSGGSAELKRILLKWANKSLNKRDMKVTKFTNEWRDGMAFLTIIHDHDPSLVPDYETRTAENREDNLEVAFAAAETLGASRLLYVEDMVGEAELDENSVVTYVAELHSAILEDKNRRAEESAKSAHEEADKVTKDAQSQMNEIQQKLDNEASRNEKLMEELNAAKNAQEESDKVAKDAQTQISEIQQKLEEETDKKIKLEEEMNEVKKVQEELDKEAKEAKEKVSEIQKKLEEETDKKIKMEEEMNQMKKAQEESEKEAKEAKEKVTEIQKMLDEERQKNEKLLEELNNAKKIQVEEVKEEKKEEVKEEIKEEVKEEKKEEEVKKEEVKEEEKKEVVEEVKKEEEKKEDELKKKEEDEFDFMHSFAILLAVITSGLLPLWLAIPSYALLADRIIQDKFPYLKEKIPAATRKLMTFGIVAFNIAVAVLSGGGAAPAAGAAAGAGGAADPSA